MTRLLTLIVGWIAASAAINGWAQSKADNDPFKYAVYTGRMVCEDKVMVTIAEDKKRPHHFDVAVGKSHYKTERVPTDSGAIRLEAKAHGIVWLQMSNKSMLFNEKAGKRLANNCRNDEQIAVEQALATSIAPTVLDTPPAKSP